MAAGQVGGDHFDRGAAQLVEGDAHLYVLGPVVDYAVRHEF